MRLWHQELIPYLDNKRLLSQHRECCALRGKGWGKKHSVVDYVFKHPPAYLFCYHHHVMVEMSWRGYNVESNWWIRGYRGKNIEPYKTRLDFGECDTYLDKAIYPEHDNNYLRECLLLLKKKGACLVNGMNIEEMLIDLDLNEHLQQ